MPSYLPPPPPPAESQREVRGWSLSDYMAGPDSVPSAAHWPPVVGGCMGGPFPSGGVLAVVDPSAWAVGGWLCPQRALAGALPWVSGPAPFPMLPLTEALPGVGRILSTCWPVADLRSDPALPAMAPCLLASVPSPPWEHLGLLGSAGHCWAPSSSSSSRVHCSSWCLL